MGPRTAWMTFGLAATGFCSLLGVAWINKFGDFAHSPQKVEMAVGSSTFVAGGRAKVWFACVDLGPQVEISCRNTSRMIELTDEPSEEVCGIRIRKLDIFQKQVMGHPALRGVFEVTWDEKR